MRSIEEQTILITGSTDGLGRGVSRELASRGATVLLHGRDDARLDVAAAAIREDTGSDRLREYRADLSSLDEVRRLAEDVRAKEERLDALVNNAGVITGPERELSRDGYELTFAVNYLSHFRLTLDLLPLLRDSAPARIVNVASVGQAPIDFSDVMLERDFDRARAYSQSKLAQIMFTFELAEREGDPPPTVNALHPATLMDTKMVREEIGRGPVSTVEEGIEATLRLVVDPDLDQVTGRYFSGTGESTADGQAYDEDDRRRLWELSEKLTR
jgi:NAD(P)-dependent dehydrogenase (short-subunit alcohol dehydrogenase family)